MKLEIRLQADTRGDDVFVTLIDTEGTEEIVAVIRQPSDVLPFSMQASALVGALLVQMVYEARAAAG